MNRIIGVLSFCLATVFSHAEEFSENIKYFSNSSASNVHGAIKLLGEKRMGVLIKILNLLEKQDFDGINAELKKHSNDPKNIFPDYILKYILMDVEKNSAWQISNCLLLEGKDIRPEIWVNIVPSNYKKTSILENGRPKHLISYCLNFLPTKSEEVIICGYGGTVSVDNVEIDSPVVESKEAKPNGD